MNVNNSALHTSGTYTLLNFASQVGSGQFSLEVPRFGNVTSSTAGRDVFTLLDNPTSLQLTVAATPNPGVAYYNGAVSLNWNDASNPTIVNWSSNLAGTNDAGNIPSSNTDVILTANTGSLSGC